MVANVHHYFNQSTQVVETRLLWAVSTEQRHERHRGKLMKVKVYRKLHTCVNLLEINYVGFLSGYTGTADHFYTQRAKHRFILRKPSVTLVFLLIRKEIHKS
jgi:hypothetical protein